jgi:uncharacterized protein (DUF1697 family)
MRGDANIAKQSGRRTLVNEDVLPTKPRAARDGVFVALLRGVNVGGKNMVSMRALKASFEKLGFEDVMTYINSGNIIFRSKDKDPRAIEKRLERMMSEDYGLPCRVVVRSSAEMAALVASLPKNWDGGSDWRYNVIFLRHTIDSKDVLRELNPNPDIEEVAYRPGTLLWAAQVKHLTRTTMLKLSSQKIYQDMTVRNLNTTKKLHELMSKMGQVEK